MTYSILVSAIMIICGSIVYRYIGGGVINGFEGRGKRLATSIPAYYLVAVGIASFVGLTHYAILFVTLYFFLMFITRSPEIGCYYLWEKSPLTGDLTITRAPTTFYNKSLIKYHGFFAAQKLRIVVYPAACTLIIAIVSLIYFAIPLNPASSTEWAIGFSLSAFLVMLIGPYLAYITNTQHSGTYTNIDVESAEYVMGACIAIASMFIIEAI